MATTLKNMKNVKATNPGDLKEAAPYKSTMSPKIDKLATQVANREDFSYDPDQDAAYKAYEKKYTRLGNNAREDTLADVAGNTGGMASSYAVSAASQAQNDYNQQLTDIIPQLMQAAYERYDADRNYDINAMGALQDVDTARFGQYDANRNYGLNTWQAKMDNYFNALGYNFDLANALESQRQFGLNYKLDNKNLNETIRHNKKTEKIDKYNAKTSRISATKK